MSPELQPRKRPAYGLPVSVDAIVATASDIQTLMAEGIRPDGSLKPEAIRALLKLKGKNVKLLAETSSYSDAYFHQVIDRVRKDATVEDVIAESIGIKADRIWGRRSEPAA